MLKYLAGIYFLLCSLQSSGKEILPKEGSSLNYRLVGFLVPPYKQASHYLFEIAKGNYTSPQDFEQHIITSIPSETNKIIGELPAFGEEYTWRVKYLDMGNKQAVQTSLYHFSTAFIPLVDTTKYRLRIIDTALAYKGMFILSDLRVMYDMKGNPVWFLPDIGNIMNGPGEVRDLRPTSSGTFTFLKDRNAYEVDYNGRLLWTAPHGIVMADSTEAYHHEFTRLSNTHYMVAGEELIPSMAVAAAETYDPADACKTLSAGTIIEYDKEGRVAWYWKSSAYFLNAVRYRQPDGYFNINTHLNAFYFDEQHEVIYASFRNVNTILKIAYPSGEVLADYAQGDDGLFFHQHACRTDSRGLLYMFSNNITDADKEDKTPSTVIKLKEPASGQEQIFKEWEFNCNIDSYAPMATSNGGSVFELPDGSLLVNMGYAGRMFIVSAEKKVTWNALVEYYNGKWILKGPYKANFIAGKSELEEFVFAGF